MSESDSSPIANIELTSFTQASELAKIIENLNYVNEFEVDRVANPGPEEPDFYLLSERGDNDD